MRRTESRDHGTPGLLTFFAWGGGGGSVAWVRAARWTATVVMGDIGKEITEIELEPLPDDPPAEEPVEPTTEPVPG